ncbi:MAG TPA: HK97 family phage prohead protease [Armatimonadota bacterium]|nr:HK97 family phage prohead protease [Armatimonadota bacterium]
MPYENEHSCRLKEPNYEKYARENCKVKHDGKCIDYVYGIKGPDESELQAMRYPKDIWTADSAKAHCKEADGSFEPAKEEDSALQAERRFVPFIGEMRAVDDDGAMIIEGYPIVYDVYALIWGFREIIRPGAATEILKSSDELVLWDHESSQPMARRSAGTLEVKEDEKGVFIHANVSKTVWGRNGFEAIQNGIINRMSFAFDVEEDRWFWEGEGDDRIEIREILSFANLYDYSPVSYPAYKETVVMARCRDLALRHHPEPRALGDGSRALLEVVQMSKDALSQDPWPYLKE